MEPVWRIKLRSNDKKALLDFIFDERLDTSCGGPKKLEDGTFEIEAFVKDSQKDSITSRKNTSINYEIYDNLIESATKKQNHVSKQNRYSRTISKDLAQKPEVRGFGVKE
jgi:hypothetical protein